MCRLPFGDLELCGGWGDWRAASHQTKKGFDVHIWRSIANCCLKQQNVCHGTISWDSLNAYIFQGPPKSTVTYTWQNSSSGWAQTLDNLRHHWSPNVHPLLDLSAGVHTWCWTRDVQEPGMWKVNTFDSKMSQFVRSWTWEGRALFKVRCFNL